MSLITKLRAEFQFNLASLLQSNGILEIADVAKKWMLIPEAIRTSLSLPEQTYMQTLYIQSLQAVPTIRPSAPTPGPRPVLSSAFKPPYGGAPSVPPSTTPPPFVARPAQPAANPAFGAYAGPSQDFQGSSFGDKQLRAVTAADLDAPFIPTIQSLGVRDAAFLQYLQHELGPDTLRVARNLITDEDKIDIKKRFPFQSVLLLKLLEDTVDIKVTGAVIRTVLQRDLLALSLSQVSRMAGSQLPPRYQYVVATETGEIKNLKMEQSYVKMSELGRVLSIDHVPLQEVNIKVNGASVKTVLQKDAFPLSLVEVSRLVERMLPRHYVYSLTLEGLEEAPSSVEMEFAEMKVSEFGAVVVIDHVEQQVQYDYAIYNIPKAVSKDMIAAKVAALDPDAAPATVLTKARCALFTSFLENFTERALGFHGSQIVQGKSIPASFVSSVPLKNVPIFVDTAIQDAKFVGDSQGYVVECTVDAQKLNGILHGQGTVDATDGATGTRVKLAAHAYARVFVASTAGNVDIPNVATRIMGLDADDVVAAFPDWKIGGHAVIIASSKHYEASLLPDATPLKVHAVAGGDLLVGRGVGALNIAVKVNDRDVVIEGRLYTIGRSSVATTTLGHVTAPIKALLPPYYEYRIARKEELVVVASGAAATMLRDVGGYAIQAIYIVAIDAPPTIDVMLGGRVVASLMRSPETLAQSLNAIIADARITAPTLFEFQIQWTDNPGTLVLAPRFGIKPLSQCGDMIKSINVVPLTAAKVVPRWTYPAGESSPPPIRNDLDLDLEYLKYKEGKAVSKYRVQISPIGWVTVTFDSTPMEAFFEFEEKTAKFYRDPK